VTSIEKYWPNCIQITGMRSINPAAKHFLNSKID